MLPHKYKIMYMTRFHWLYIKLIFISFGYSYADMLSEMYKIYVLYTKNSSIFLKYKQHSIKINTMKWCDTIQTYQISLFW